MAYIPSGKEEILFLENFDGSKYKKPAVAADTAMFSIDGSGLKILLIKRGGYPYKGCWALPGGFIEINEDPLKAAERELLEETGVSVNYLEQVFVWGKPDRDPRQRVITLSYVSVTDISNIKAGDDASDAAWFNISYYSKIEDKGYTFIKFSLSGPEALHAEVKYPSGQIQRIERTDSGGLAFDHAESIVYSMEYLKKRVHEGGFLELALKNADSVEAAKNTIMSI